MRIDLAQLEFIEPKLREIAIEVERHFGVDFTVTSLFRLPLNGPSVHNTLPLRGMDLRCRDSHLGSTVEAFVNHNWVYDPARPEKKCCMAHGDPYHLHLQVHPNTIDR